MNENEMKKLIDETVFTARKECFESSRKRAKKLVSSNLGISLNQLAKEIAKTKPTQERSKQDILISLD